MMNDGYMRVATANIHTTLGNCTKNKETIISKINELQSQNPDLILFNELSLTGSSLDDLFFQEFVQCNQNISFVRKLWHFLNKSMFY